MSSPVPGVDSGLRAGPARLTGMTSQPDPLDDLYAAVGAFTGLGRASPLAADIVGAVMAAIAAARLIEHPSYGSATAPGTPEGVTRHDARATPQPWRNLAGARHVWPAARSMSRDIPRLSLARTPALPTQGQMCGILAVDIAGFTRPDRDDDIRRYLHERLYEYVQRALDHSGVPWAECFWEDRGDGALIVLPPEIPAKGLIDPFPDKLRALIRRHNHVSCSAADMQLRAAVHIGPVEYDDHGFVGTDVNFTFRMLEARSLKRRLAESSAEVGLVVSDFVYDSLVCRHPSLVHPDAFRALRFQTKNTRARAWTYLPGASF